MCKILLTNCPQVITTVIKLREQLIHNFINSYNMDLICVISWLKTGSPFTPSFIFS